MARRWASVAFAAVRLRVRAGWQERFGGTIDVDILTYPNWRTTAFARRRARRFSPAGTGPRTASPASPRRRPASGTGMGTYTYMPGKSNLCRRREDHRIYEPQLAGRSRPSRLLRLPRRRDEPVVVRPGVRQPPGGAARYARGGRPQAGPDAASATSTTRVLPRCRRVPSIRSRSYSTAAEVDVESPAASGVLFSHGARFRRAIGRAAASCDPRSLARRAHPPRPAIASPISFAPITRHSTAMITALFRPIQVFNRARIAPERSPSPK
jgi:hypothetical protein